MTYIISTLDYFYKFGQLNRNCGIFKRQRKPLKVNEFH